MTWFRVGGAGIPVSLKNGMNTVLNKKFGTSGQNYPPNQWPDEVNLMGPLPEGTASGSIANISDGADQVPIKLWNSNVDESVDGVSEVDCTQMGKNFYPIQIGADRFSNNGGATHSNDNGTLVITATTNNNCGVYINTDDALCELRNVLKFFNDNNIPRVISFDVVCTVNNASLAVTSGNRTVYTMGTTKTRISHTSTGANCSMYVQGADLGQACTFEISNFQVEYGSTGSAYKQYIAPSVKTVSLGRTIHGGSLELISGAGTDENGVNFTFDPISPIPETENVCNFWTNVGSSSIVYRRDIDLALQAVSSSRGLMMASRPVTQLVGEESDPDQVNELVEDDENDIREQLNEVVENDETEQEGENDAR